MNELKTTNEFNISFMELIEYTISDEHTILFKNLNRDTINQELFKKLKETYDKANNKNKYLMIIEMILKSKNYIEYFSFIQDLKNIHGKLMDYTASDFAELRNKELCDIVSKIDIEKSNKEKTVITSLATYLGFRSQIKDKDEILDYLGCETWKIK